MRERLFLDANVMFSAAYRRNSGLRRLWQLTEVDLLTSGYAVEEARRNLDAGKISELDPLLEKMEIAAAMPSAVAWKPAVDLPEKDRPILAGAIHAKATHLITGDVTHFGPYFGSKIGGVLIITPAGYLKTK
jgi:predicted nucleic acid-binding protein